MLITSINLKKKFTNILIFTQHNAVNCHLFLQARLYREIISAIVTTITWHDDARSDEANLRRLISFLHQDPNYWILDVLSDPKELVD